MSQRKLREFCFGQVVGVGTGKEKRWNELKESVQFLATNHHM